jgi:CubicO group peptidase (beta-lactamase class C family)
MAFLKNRLIPLYSNRSTLFFLTTFCPQGTSMRRFLPLFLIFISVNCARSSADLRARHIARIEGHLVAPDYAKPIPAGHASLAERLAYWQVPGVGIAVINDGKVEWAKGYGVTDLATGSPVDEHTLFHGASLSKPIHAMVLLKFVREGKIDLDKDINQQLTGWQLPASEFAKGTTITPRRMLSHTAGMSWAAFGTGYPASQPSPKLVDLLNGKPPATQPVRVEETPGKRFHYSGGAVMATQLLLQEIAKEPYPAIVKRCLIDPLWMTESTMEQTLSGEQLQHAAPGFKAGKRVNGPDRIYPAMSAAGLWGTPADYCKVVMEIQRAAADGADGAVTDAPAKVISPGAARVMLTPYIPNAKSANPRPSTVGMGVFLSGQGKGRMFFHAGSHAGYSCYMIGRLEGGQGVVVMTNGDDAFDLIAEIVQTVADEYDWPDYQFIPPPRLKPATQPTTQPASQPATKPAKAPTTQPTTQTAQTAQTVK